MAIVYAFTAETERENVDHLTCFMARSLGTRGHQWQEILHAIGFGAQDYDVLIAFP